jgi:hypothetical protein
MMISRFTLLNHGEIQNILTDTTPGMETGKNTLSIPQCLGTNTFQGQTVCPSQYTCYVLKMLRQKAGDQSWGLWKTNLWFPQSEGWGDGPTSIKRLGVMGEAAVAWNWNLSPTPINLTLNWSYMTTPSSYSFKRKEELAIIGWRYYCLFLSKIYLNHSNNEGTNLFWIYHRAKHNTWFLFVSNNLNILRKLQKN